MPLPTATDAAPDRHPAGLQLPLRGCSRVLVIGDLLNQWSAPAPKRHPTLPQCTTNGCLAAIGLSRQKPKRPTLEVTTLDERQQGVALLPRLLHGGRPHELR